MSIRNVASNLFKEHGLQFQFPEGVTTRKEVENVIEELEKKNYHIEYFYNDLEREIYKGLIDGRFDEDEVWSFLEAGGKEALGWLAKMFYDGMSDKFEEYEDSEFYTHNEEDDMFEAFVVRVGNTAKWKRNADGREKVLKRARRVADATGKPIPAKKAVKKKATKE